MPNIIVHCAGTGPGPRHLVMNGHVDVFPVAKSERWTHDPWGAELVGNTIVGRGACDMKSGTTALLFAFLALNEVREALSGCLTLTIVSDEETFGPFGSRHLLAARPDVIGDCLLNAEPTSSLVLRYGEKGPLWLRFEIETAGAHSAYTHMSRNAIEVAAELSRELSQLTGLKSPDTELLETELHPHRAAIDAAYGDGASSIISKVTVNPALVNAGVKINMIPGHCSFDVDVRVPPGLSRDDIIAEVQTIVDAIPGARFNILHFDAPNRSPVDHPMIGMLQANAYLVSGIVPAPVIGLGATDARLWRQSGVPAFVYGPKPHNMGTANEAVDIDEFMLVAKVHALSAFDYLA